MKALVKIGYVVVILACAASLFFSYKLSGIQTNLENDKQELTAKLDTTESTLAQTKKDLEASQTELKQARDQSVEAQAQLEAEKTKLAQKTREAENLEDKVSRLEGDLQVVKDEKAKAENEVDKIKEAMRELGLEDLTEIEAVREKLTALTDESKMLADQLKTAKAENARLVQELQEAKKTPEGLRARVALAKSLWNFVVLDVGAADKVQPQSSFIVYRDNQLIGKARVTTVYPTSSVAELDPTFTTTAPKAGDIAIHEKL